MHSGTGSKRLDYSSAKMWTVFAWDLFAAGLVSHLSADFSQGCTSLFEVEVIGAGQ
jgi:hypothetical protein